LKFSFLPAAAVSGIFVRENPARDDGLDSAFGAHIKSLNFTFWQKICAQKTKPDVVVAITRFPVIAIRRPTVVSVVVPTTAADNPVRAFF